jgi:uncharacterized protein YhaN
VIINLLQIRGFGLHRDRLIRLSEGVNIILGPNESGKSTIMDFVRAMFYGFGRSGGSVDKDWRRKAKPWDGGVMGGKIEFSHRGRQYRLERTFGSRRPEDETMLCYAGTGDIIRLPEPDKPGLSIFGLSEAEFVNTVFVAQQDVFVNAVPELTSRVFGLGGDDGLPVVRKRLTDARLELTGKRGKIAVLEKRRAELFKAKEQAIQSDDEAAVIVSRLKDVADRRTAIEAGLAEAGEERRLEEALELVSRAAELSRLEGEEEEGTRFADIKLTEAGRNMTVHALADLTDLHESWKKAGQEAAALRSWADKKADEYEEAIEAYDQLAEERNRVLLEAGSGQVNAKPPRPPAAPDKRVLLLSLVLAALLLGLSLILGTGHSAFLPLIIFSALAPLAAFIFYTRQANLIDREYRRKVEHWRRAVEAEEERKETLSGLTSELEAAGRAFNHLRRDIARLAEELNRLYAVAERAKLELRRELMLYCGVVPDDALDHAIARLSEQASEEGVYRRRLIERVLGGRDRRTLEREAAAARMYLLEEGIGDKEIELAVSSLKMRRRPDTEGEERLRSELAALDREEAQLLRDLDWLAGKGETTPDIERDLLLLDQELERAELLADALTLAVEWLDRAMSDVADQLSPRLNEEASSWLSAVTDGRYRRLLIDKDFSILVEKDDGSLAESGHFSGATKDQIALALRLSLSSIVSEDAGALPLWFDDTLVQLDEIRTSKTFDVIRRAKGLSGRQLCYLTFDADLAEKAAAEGAHLIRLEAGTK